MKCIQHQPPFTLVTLPTCVNALLPTIEFKHYNEENAK